MEIIEPRPWWRLEPESSDPERPTEVSPALLEYHRTHYRDQAAIDTLMRSRLDGLGSRQPEGFDPVGLEEFDPYGTPLTSEAGTAESWTTWFNTCLDRIAIAPGSYREWFLAVAKPDLLDRFTDDESLVAAIPPNPRGEAPPGSLVGVRHRGMTSFYEGACNLGDRTNTLEHHLWATGVGLKVYDAQLFWLPDPVGAECLTSEPPEPELTGRIRLPFESVLVGLARPVPAIALGESDEETWRIGMAADGTRGALAGEPHLSGVWMAAGEGGFGVAPVVVWFVDTAGGVSAVPGVWSRSAYAGAVANLGAVLTWQDWTEPPALAEAIGDPDTRERRKALKKGAVRKAIARGALHKVRVLTIPGKAAAVSDPTVEGEESLGRRSPIRHWRRGHWTKVRVATRSPDGQIVGSTSGEKNVDWSYEGRWIRPLLINPEGVADPGAKVYKQVARGGA